LRGNQVGVIYSLTGDLSDCVPVLAGDKLVWYTWKNETLQFYQININDLSDYTVKNVVLTGQEIISGDGSETKPGDGSEIIPGDSSKIEPVDDEDIPAIIAVNKTAISKAENKAAGVKLTWKKISGAAGYVVYRKNSGSKSWKKIKTVKGASKTTYTDSTVKSKHGTTYSYRIESYKSVNGQTAKAVSKEKTILRLTAPTKLKTANQRDRKLSVTWKKQKKISGYQIQYSTGKTFAKGTKTTNTAKSSGKAVIKKLKKGKIYYVRIRSYQKSGSKKTYSAWSSYTKVKIKK